MTLKTASSTFQRVLNTIFAAYLYQFLIIDVDDTEEDALRHYELVLKRAAEEPIAVQNQHKELELIAYKFAEYLLKKNRQQSLRF